MITTIHANKQLEASRIGTVLNFGDTLLNCKPSITGKEIDRALYITDLVLNNTDLFKQLGKIHGTTLEQYQGLTTEIECFKRFFSLKKKDDLLCVVEFKAVDALPNASTLKKDINEDFINEKINFIKQVQSRGKATFIVGRHSCNSATKEHLRGLLLSKRYTVSNSCNSHGVDTLVVTW